MALEETGDALNFIDGVQITFLVARDDLTCPMDQSTAILEQLGSNILGQQVYDNADHDFFSWSNQIEFM